MKILLPVDSRIGNTQGFIILNTITGETIGYETEELLNYNRSGFRGATVVKGLLYVCNSFSIKVYRISKELCSNVEFIFVKQIHRPEWLLGRQANADLHMLHYNGGDIIYLANSFMDCIDVLTLDGELINRVFLWEISSFVDRLIIERNPKAPDLCHLNHITSFKGELLLTLGNLNKTSKGAIMSYSTGEMVLDKLVRPHDGVFDGEQYFVSETGTSRVLVYNGINSLDNLKNITPILINPFDGLVNSDNSKYWLRGLLVVENLIYIACSQFQDRLDKSTLHEPTFIVSFNRFDFKMVRRYYINSIGNLNILYSIH